MEKQINMKTFSTENFKVEKEEKVNPKNYNMESVYYITNTIGDGTTYVIEETIDELISILKYLKSI